MSDQKLNRREFFMRAALLGAAATGVGGFLSACERQNGQQGGGQQQEGGAASADLDCEDTTGLEEAEVKLRESLQYTDESPKPDQQCANCELFEEPEQPGTCGGCQTVPGPIHPQGWCSAWVAAT